MGKYSNIQEFTIECIAKDSQSVELDRDSVVVKVLPFTTKLKKTGQTTTYSNYDDGYYQKGAINYTRDDTKQIVIDHITGLEWQDDTNISKPWLTQANYNAGNYSDTSGDTATTYCSTLTLGGYNDWRLPTVKELFYIVDNSKINPTIDSHFQNVVSDDYWSSTSDARYTNYAWYVYFYDGTTYTVVRTIVTMFVV